MRSVIRRRWRVVAVLVVVLLAGSLVVVGVREGQLEHEAASAAINAISGDDPAGGTHGSCEYKPGLSLVVLRAHYDCVVKICASEIARLEITHVVGAGWSFTVDHTSQSVPKHGHTAPAVSATPETDPRFCPPSERRAIPPSERRPQEAP
jgi:hypothetical protein